MTVKARIVTIKLIEKMNRLPGYAERIGLSANDLKTADDGKQQTIQQKVWK